MIISKKGKKYEFKTYFKDVDSLKKFISEKNKFINVYKLENKIAEIHQKLTNSTDVVREGVVDWFIVQQFKFKYRSAFKLDFWLERGFGVEEFSNWISERRKGDKLVPITENSINNFQYGKFKFKITGIPKCNLCQSSLRNEILGNRYFIKECENENCASNFNKETTTIRQLAFLPLSLVKEKNKRINFENKLNFEYWLLKGLSYKDSFNEISLIRKKLNKLGDKISPREHLKITRDMSDSEIDDFFRKCSNLTIEYWFNLGFSEDDSKVKVSEMQTKNSEKFSIKRKNQPSLYSATTSTQVGFWLHKGFSEEEAKNKVSERQSTFSLVKCIKRYGEKDGTKRFIERQSKWINSIHKNGNMCNGYSKVSQNLFSSLTRAYKNEEKDMLRFAEHNNEFSILRDDNQYYSYDFTDLKRKKIIEYNGDSFHANPKIYNEHDTPNPFNKEIKSSDIWLYDKIKENKAIENGYEVLVIWDSELKKNKEKVINKCLNFLFS